MRTEDQSILTNTFSGDDRFQSIAPHNGRILVLFEGNVYGVDLSPSSLSLGVAVFRYDGYCMGSSLSESNPIYQTFNTAIKAGAHAYLKRVAQVGNLAMLPEALKDYALSNPSLLAA